MTQAGRTVTGTEPLSWSARFHTAWARHALLPPPPPPPRDPSQKKNIHRGIIHSPHDAHVAPIHGSNTEVANLPSKTPCYKSSSKEDWSRPCPPPPLKTYSGSSFRGRSLNLCLLEVSMTCVLSPQRSSGASASAPATMLAGLLSHGVLPAPSLKMPAPSPARNPAVRIPWARPS
jgi:hypothetical protein